MEIKQSQKDKYCISPHIQNLDLNVYVYVCVCMRTCVCTCVCMCVVFDESGRTMAGEGEVQKEVKGTKGGSGGGQSISCRVRI